MTTMEPAHLPEHDYFSIERALMATAKGRRFLLDYLHRNRSCETQKLLRSIARLHRAAVGAGPDFAADVQRDIGHVLQNLMRLRKSAPSLPDDAARLSGVLAGLQQVEAALIALAEAIEERSGGPAGDEEAARPVDVDEPMQRSARTAKLYGELSSLFSQEGPASPAPSS